jgi:hypothetical protein
MQEIVTKQIVKSSRSKSSTRWRNAAELRHAQFLRSLAQIHVVDLRDAALLLAVGELVS